MVNVDVILISYNQEQYIAQAIESILSQKVTDDISVRVLIADDCSTDNTLNIIKSYESQSPFIFVYTNFGANLGMHENYRRTFELCNGDYVAILEGDDWWHSNFHIQQHVDFLDKHEKYSMTFNNIRFFDTDKNDFLSKHWSYPQDYKRISLKQQILYGNHIGNLSSCVFRLNLLRTLPNRFYSITFADWELGIWMAKYGDIVELKESTSTYRIDYKGLWTKLSNSAKNESMIRTLEDMDILTDGKYHKLFQKGKFNILNDIREKPYRSWKTKIKLFLGIIK